MLHVLRGASSALSKVERDERKALRLRVKKQVITVLRQADDNHIPMELPEAEEIAEVNGTATCPGYPMGDAAVSLTWRFACAQHLATTRAAAVAGHNRQFCQHKRQRE